MYILNRRSVDDRSWTCRSGWEEDERKGLRFRLVQIFHTIYLERERLQPPHFTSPCLPLRHISQKSKYLQCIKVYNMV